MTGALLYLRSNYNNTIESLHQAIHIQTVESENHDSHKCKPCPTQDTIREAFLVTPTETTRPAEEIRLTYGEAPRDSLEMMNKKLEALKALVKDLQTEREQLEIAIGLSNATGNDFRFREKVFRTSDKVERKDYLLDYEITALGPIESFTWNVSPRVTKISYTEDKAKTRYGIGTQVGVMTSEAGARLLYGLNMEYDFLTLNLSHIPRDVNHSNQSFIFATGMKIRW